MQLFQGSGGSSQSTNSNSQSSTQNDFAPWFNALTHQVVDQAKDLSNYNTHPFPFYTGEMFAPFSQDQTNAFAGVRGAQANPFGWNATSGGNSGDPVSSDPISGVAGQFGPTPMWQQAYNSGNAAMNSSFPQAQGYFSQAGQQPTALQAGAPYAGQAAQTWNSPGVADSYMNPFIGNSINYGNQLASENFLQNTLPGLTNQFVASGGGLGSKQYGKSMDWALKNFNNTIAGNTQNALSQGYFNSGNLFNADQNRLAGLSGTVGNQAATSTGSLGTLGAQVAGSGVGAAGAFAGLGSGSSGTNLANLNALLQTGNQQQQFAQNPLTFAYQQQQQANQWPYQLTNFGANIAGGLAGAVPTSSTNQSSSNSTMSGGQNSSPSPFGSILGVGSALSSFIPGIGPAIGSLGSLFGSAAGGSGVPGLDAMTGMMQMRKRGGSIPRGGYFGMDAPSRPDFYERPAVPRGGYRSSLDPRGVGYFAAGGHAPVVRAARQAARRDIGAFRAEQRNPEIQGERRPLRFARGGHFAGLPAPHMIESPRLGYFSRTA